MFRGLKDYLHFNKAERKGIISLLVLIVIIITVKQNLYHFQTEGKNNSEEYNRLMAKIDSLENSTKVDLSKFDEIKPLSYPIDSLSPFNPNTIDTSGWEKFGLSKRQAEVIMNYQAKGGTFKVKKDVKKMFVISDSLYANIEAFILLPDTIKYENKKYKKQSSSKSSYKKFKKRSYPKILINSADTAAFKKLYGIGEVLAERIVKHREALGGFYTKDQLTEIYGLRQEVILRLDTQLILNPIPLNKIKLNSVTKEELKKHPYLYWKQANAIVNYRKQHGNFEKIEDLKKVILVPDSLYNKLKPYLDL